MKKVLLTAVLMMVLFTTAVSAQNSSKETVKVNVVSEKLDARAVKDLIRGIKSDNAGLRKSCIYMAGFYEITETAGALTERLEVEKDADTRILIALSLFRIGGDSSLNTVKSLSETDRSDKVRRISKAILNEYSKSGSLYTAISSIN